MTRSPSTISSPIPISGDTTQACGRRLLIVAPSAYLLGGLATWLDYLEPRLSGLGWSVTIGLVQGPRWHHPAAYLADHPHRRVMRIPCHTGTSEGRRRAILMAIDEVRPDLLATVNIPDAIAAVAMARCSGRRAPRVVMTCHGIQPDLFDDMARYGSALDGVVCTNRLAGALATRLGRADTSRVHYAPYGTDDAQPRRATSAMNDGPLRIVYAGRIEESQKRVSTLAEIADRLHDRGLPFVMQIAGDGPDEASFRERLRAHVAAGRVEFLGRVSTATLRREVYPQADALLVTSSWETGPIVIWEAWAHGLAVVSSRYLGSGLEAALVDRENALLFDVGDADAAAACLARLHADRRLLAALASSGLRTQQTRYSIDASCDAWSECFAAVLASPQRAAPSALDTPAPRGRLDRWLGARAAESIRQWTGRRAPDGGPGGEWPHTHSAVSYNDPAFWALAEELDRSRVDSGPTGVARMHTEIPAGSTSP